MKHIGPTAALLDETMQCIELIVAVPWPDTDAGHSSRLAMIEVADHVWLVYAAMKERRYTPIYSIPRLLNDRLDILDAVSTHPAFAQVYLRSIEQGVERKGRTLADEARGVIGRQKHPADQNARAAFHAPRVAIAAAHSRFVHGSSVLPSSMAFQAVLDSTSDEALTFEVIGSMYLLTTLYQVFAIAYKCCGAFESDASNIAPQLAHAITELVRGMSEDFRSPLGEVADECTRIAAQFNTGRQARSHQPG